MGNIPGVQAPQNTRKKYTDNEIKQNIKQLFDKNRHNVAETSYSLDETLNVSSNKNEGHIGGVKFQSSKNRHLKHNINEYVENLQKQYGGQDNSNNQNDNNELFEFNKIKEYLLNDLENNEQNGGYKSSELSNFSFSQEETRQYKNKSLIDVLMGGKKDMVTSSIEDTTSLSPSDTTSDSLEETYGTSDSDSDVSDVSSDSDKPMHSGTISPTSDASVPVDGSYSSTSYSTTNKFNNTNAAYIVQSSESSLDTSVSFKDNNYSENSESSEQLNIVPFYSTESSNRPPYVAKRFKR